MSDDLTSTRSAHREVVREAPRDWKTKRGLQVKELEALKADIKKGLIDLAAGRVAAQLPVGGTTTRL